MIIILFLIFCPPSSSTTTTTIYMSDKSTMDSLLTAVTPTPLAWSSATKFCRWRGVKCDSKKRVISLSLASQSLYGILPASINSLSRLTTLSIENNNFYGPLPSLSNLSCLRKLYIDNNNFSYIPRGAFSKLTSLSILSLSNNTNLYPWPFPYELIYSPKLTAFYASNANIMGSIPDIFLSFPKLANLTLSFNNLTGLLPTSFSASSIQYLKIDNQIPGLTGNINVLTGMNQLSLAWLQDNSFTGVVPPSFLSLPNLANLRLENNNFILPIPHFPTKIFVPFNCRPCKVYIRVDHFANAPLAPFEKNDYSSAKKPNVGAVVGYSFLLLFILLVCFYCICCCYSSPRNDGFTSGEEVVEQRRVHIDKKITEEIVGGVDRNGMGKEGAVGPQPGRVNEGEKEAEKKKVLVQLDEEGNQHPRKKGAEGAQPGRVNEGEKESKKKKVLVQRGKKGNQHPRKKGAVGAQPGRVNEGEKEVKTEKVLVQHPPKDGVEGQDGKGVEGKIQPQKVVEEQVPAVQWDRDTKAGKQPQQVVEDQGFLPKKYSIQYIRTITKNFDQQNVIGEGGFAQVYKGDPLNGTIVAVKCLKQKIGRIIDDFKNEVEALGRTSHFNLVRLIGYCAEDEHKMLVYEYMCNGSLEEWIFGTNTKRSLSWPEKKKVILGIVEGLVYLHKHCDKKILHRDLKPQNVLLDDKKNAKLCDFGISKLLERDQSSTSTKVLGTFWYMAPEVVKGEKISEKVDVYSFGIVVLEVLFGKKYRDLKSSNQTFFESSQLVGLINNLSDEMRKNGKEIERIAKMALLCLKEKAEDRPCMFEILCEIKRADAQVRRN